MKKVLASYECPATADCYVAVTNTKGRWSYHGWPVDLWSANYSPSLGILEHRWSVSPADEGLSQWNKAQGAILALGLTRNS